MVDGTHWGQHRSLRLAGSVGKVWLRNMEDTVRGRDTPVSKTEGHKETQMEKRLKEWAKHKKGTGWYRKERGREWMGEAKEGPPAGCAHPPPRKTALPFAK